MHALTPAGTPCAPRGSIRRRDSAPARSGDGLGLGRRGSWGHSPAASSRETGADGPVVEPGSARRVSADASGRSGGAEVWRNALWNKNVVTRTRGVQLGVTTQVWVDPATWTCVALEVRPSWVAPTYGTLALPSLRGVGDVLLVHDASVLEPQGDWAPGGCDPLVGADVVTEAGEFLGKVRDFALDAETGRITRLRCDSFGQPWVPEAWVSVYELSMDDVVSATPRPGLLVVAAAGAEGRLKQVTASLLQRLQLAEPPWEESRRYGGGSLDPPLWRQADVAQQQRGARPRGRADTVAPQWAPPPRDQRLASDGSGRPRRGSRPRVAAPAGAQQPQGIPLMRRSTPGERRDADGQFGEQGASNAAPQQQPQQRREAVPYESWAQPDARREAVGELAGEATGGPDKRRAFNAREDLL